MIKADMFREAGVSIVITAWNAEAYIGRCVTSCKEQTYPYCEIVLVDNGSTDRTAEVASAFAGDVPLLVVKLEVNAGFAGGANVGIQAAAGKYILMLNSDAELDKNYIESAVRSFVSDRRTGMVGGPTYNCNGSERLKSLQSASNYIVSYLQLCSYPEKSLHEGDRIFAAPSPIMIISRDALEDTRLSNGDYFDTRFWCYGEDIDLFFRLAMFNWNAVFASGCIGWHQGSMAFGGKVRIWQKPPKLQRIVSRNKYLTIAATLPLAMVIGDIWIILLVDLLRAIVCGIRNPPSFAANMLGPWDALMMLPYLVTKRLDISRRQRVRGHAIYIRILRDRFWALGFRLRKLLGFGLKNWNSERLDAGHL